MIKTTTAISVDKFELDMNDIAEIKENLPRLAKLYLKMGDIFYESFGDDPGNFAYKLELNSFQNLVDAWDKDELHDSIYDVDGVKESLDSLIEMIKEYICSPKSKGVFISSKDFDCDEELQEWIENKLDLLCTENLRAIDKLDEFINILSRLGTEN